MYIEYRPIISDYKYESIECKKIGINCLFSYILKTILLLVWVLCLIIASPVIIVVISVVIFIDIMGTIPLLVEGYPYKENDAFIMFIQGITFLATRRAIRMGNSKLHILVILVIDVILLIPEILILIILIMLSPIIILYTIKVFINFRRNNINKVIEEICQGDSKCNN